MEEDIATHDLSSLDDMHLQVKKSLFIGQSMHRAFASVCFHCFIIGLPLRWMLDDANEGLLRQNL